MNGIQSNLIDSLYKFIEEDSWDSVCSEECIRTDEGAAVTDFIKSTTSPQSFDVFCDSLKGYEPEHGGYRTALGQAVLINHLPLIHHISKQLVRLGKTHILNIGSPPPLISAIWLVTSANKLENTKSKFEISRLFLQLGTKVNLGYLTLCDDDGPTTPLKEAAGKADLSLINMLILNGGLTYRRFTEEESQNVKNALSLLFNRVKPMFIAKQCLDIFPIKEIFEKVIRHQIWVLAHTYLEVK